MTLLGASLSKKWTIWKRNSGRFQRVPRHMRLGINYILSCKWSLSSFVPCCTSNVGILADSEAYTDRRNEIYNVLYFGGGW